MEQGVLVVDCAVEGAGLVVSTGHQTGQSLETISVSETGPHLRATLGHHTHQVRAGGPLRRAEVNLKSLRNNKHLVKFLRLFYWIAADNQRPFYHHKVLLLHSPTTLRHSLL